MARDEWIAWLSDYGAGPFYDVFLHVAQGAKSACCYCGQAIFLDIVEGGGVTDWRTEDGDYGCSYSPETTKDGVGGHKAQGTAKA